MKVALVIHSLIAGGAERVLTTTANAWAERGAEVVVITLDDATRAPFYPLDERVRRRGIDILRPTRHLGDAAVNNLRAVLRLRRVLRAEQPDAVISHISRTNVLSVLATQRLAPPVVVVEHIDPAMRELHRGWALIEEAVYPRASRVAVLTPASMGRLSRRVRARAVAIPNPIAVAPGERSRDLATARPPFTLLAMGRLTRQKGFDLLIDAFAEVASQRPDWRLIIYGEGPDRSALERQVAARGMDGRIALPGVTPEPHRAMREADLFVLSSRYEGFPMVLGEAMACGLPVVATDCETGPRDIVRDGVDGILVTPNSVDALAAALDCAMADHLLRARLGAAAPEVLERYGVEAIMDRWDTLLGELTR